MCPLQSIPYHLSMALLRKRRVNQSAHGFEREAPDKTDECFLMLMDEGLGGERAHERKGEENRSG